MTTKKTAPLQGQQMRDIYSKDGSGSQLPRGFGVRYPPMPAMEIPWEDSEYAYRGYVLHGHGGQSHQRLVERGGFGIFEFLAYRAVADAEHTDHKGNGHWHYELLDAELARVSKLPNEEVVALVRGKNPPPAHCSSCSCFPIDGATGVVVRR